MLMQEVNTISRKTLFAILLSTIMLSLFVLNDANAQNLTKNKYRAMGEDINEEFKVAKERCAPLDGDAETLCNTKAEGVRDIARAKLETNFKPTIQNRYNANMISAGADYAIANKQCNTIKISEIDACKKLSKDNYIKDTANARTIRNSEKLNEINKDKTVQLDEFDHGESTYQINSFNQIFHVKT